MELFSIFFCSCEIENFALICNLVKDYGEIVRIWLGPELNVIISDSKDVEVNCGIMKKTKKSKSKENICCV